MKKITRIVPVVLGALALASCSSDEMFSNAALEATQTEGDQMIAVVDENPDAVTRYGFDNESTMNVWSTGDTYTVFDQSLVKAANYTLVDGYSGSKAGLFEVTKGKDVVDEDNKSTARYGVFPYRADNVISFADFAWTLYVTLPAEHAYEKITNQEKGDLGTKEAAVAPLPLWGSVTNEEGSRKISFKMMTSLLKVDLSSIPAGYETTKPAYLLVTSKKHKLNGRFKADITKQTDAEYSGEVGDVELVKDGDPTGTEKEIKVTFKTDGSKILNRVFYIPIPVGTYEAGDLEIKLYDGDNVVKDDLTPEAWKTSEVKIERAKAKTITYTINMEITANSIHELNNNIQKELNNLASKTTIKDGDTFTFTVTGNTTPLTPTTDDNMLLIPTFNGKNINVILNIQKPINASAEALNISEAVYGDESTSEDGQWKVKSGKTPEVIASKIAAAKRTFTVNLGGVVNSNSLVNVLAPTSNVCINATVDNTIGTLEATTANEVNSLQLGVDGLILTGTIVSSHAGGVYVGPFASIVEFDNRNTNSNDVNFCGTSKKLVKRAFGNLFIGAGANISQVVNFGKGNIIVGSGATIAKLSNQGSGDIFVQGANVAMISNIGYGAITVSEENGSYPTVKTITNGANGKDVSITANESDLIINNDSKTANLVVDFANTAYSATITDNSAVMTAGTATGNMTVKNTSGLVTLTNVGGNVELVNCSGDNVINNDVQTGTITLNSSYAATLTNNNSSAATVNTSGQAGIGTPTGKFTFVDAAWNGKAEGRNVSGNIYTAAQLAGLQTATTENTITLMTDINLNNKSFAGIKQGAMTTFDGANFTISNLSLKDVDQIGLFATAGTSDLTIQNLTLNIVKFASTGNKNCIGALVGEFNGGSLTVDNVTVEGVAISSTDADATKSKSNSIAALVGKFTGNDLKFKNANIVGTAITGNSSLAGFVGNLVSSNDVEFDACTLSGLSISVQGTIPESDNATAAAGRVGYLIGGVSGTVANLKVLANCTITPAMADNDQQREAWKYKNRKKNSSTFFWGDSNLYLGYCPSAIGNYEIGGVVQTYGITGTYNIYKGY